MPADSQPVTTQRHTARQRYDTSTASDPKEITEGAWHHARNMVPVFGWFNDANGESFKVLERKSDDATVYVRINDRHFVFEGGSQTSHAECCRHVAQSKTYAELLSRRSFVCAWADDRLP